MRRHRGFTLIELLVVFAIAGLVMSVVPFAFERLNEGSQYRSALRDIVSELRSARQKAVTEGVGVSFRIDLAQRRFGIEGTPMKSIPSSLQIKATAAAIESEDDQHLGIRFLPSGGASGGNIELIRSSGAGVRLQIDWLSGRVFQEPLG